MKDPSPEEEFSGVAGGPAWIGSVRAAATKMVRMVVTFMVSGF